MTEGKLIQMEKEIYEIADLVERLRVEDYDLRVFGADGHQYRMGPKLSEEEISDFEREHNIQLPSDYRLWLKLVGNGSGLKGRWPIAGLGPDHGIYNLQDTAFGTCTGRPFEPAFSHIDESTLRKIYEYELDDEEDELTGVLHMSTPGCAYDTYLIANGQGYGTIWSSWENEIWPTELTFSQWVRNWAEKALPRVIRERVTNSVEEGMTKAQVIKICGDDWEDVPFAYMKILRFQSLATNFELDEHDRVIRITRHSIIVRA